MHYVKLFNINGVDTKQVACIELQAPPNAATEGAVGVLGMDMSSPTHEVYRCVAVNGSVYTWELLSAGMSIVSARITKEGATSTSFAYEDLKIPTNYLIKSGDLILDSDGYLYQVSFIGGDSCNATYCGTHLGGAGASDKDYRLVVEDGTLRLVTENGNVLSEIDFLTSDEKTIHRDSSTGKASVMAIRTIDGGLLHMFIGTQDEYEKLTEAQKQNLFAIITNDTTKEGLLNAINTLQTDYNEFKNGIENGTIPATKAKNAENAERAEIANSVYIDWAVVGTDTSSLYGIETGLYVVVVDVNPSETTKHKYFTSVIWCDGNANESIGSTARDASHIVEVHYNSLTAHLFVKVSNTSGGGATNDAYKIARYKKISTDVVPFLPDL